MVAEMRMLRCMCDHTRLHKISNELIRNKVGVAPTKDKMRENKLRSFGYVKRMSVDTLTFCCIEGSVGMK